MISVICDCCFQLQACQRKLDSKCEALLILSKDLDQCRQERDQFQLMAEQVQSRYQSIKRQLAGIVSPTLHLCTVHRDDSNITDNSNLIVLSSRPSQ